MAVSDTTYLKMAGSAVILGMIVGTWINFASSFFFYSFACCGRRFIALAHTGVPRCAVGVGVYAAI